MQREKRKTVAAALTALTLLISAVAIAQGRNGGGPRDSLGEQDRISGRARGQDRDQDSVADRDQDRTGDRDRSQDQDQLHVQDRDHLRTQDIYGSELMTREERRQYRDRIQEMQTVQEWAQFRSEHQAQMLARARAQGADLPAPFYGQQLMTDLERAQLQRQLQAATSEQEREQIRAENRNVMQERAREHQIPLGELEE